MDNLTIMIKWGEGNPSMLQPQTSLEAEPPPPLIAWDLCEIEKKSLTNMFLACSKASIDMRPLTKLLSTLYGNAMVGRGHLASIGSRLSTTPCGRALDLKTLNEQQKLTMESLWMIDSILSEWSNFLEQQRKEPLRF